MLKDHLEMSDCSSLLRKGALDYGARTNGHGGRRGFTVNESINEPMSVVKYENDTGT